MLFRDYIGKLAICSKCGSVKKIVAQYTRNIDDYPPGPSYLLCKDFKTKKNLPFKPLESTL
jgi:hypothetical protein